GSRSGSGGGGGTNGPRARGEEAGWGAGRRTRGGRGGRGGGSRGGGGRRTGPRPRSSVAWRASTPRGGILLPFLKRPRLRIYGVTTNSCGAAWPAIAGL